MAEEGILERAQSGVSGEALNGDDAAPGEAGDGCEAGADLAVVEQDRAGAAVAGVAADFRTGETEGVAKKVGEAEHGVGLDPDEAAVQGEFDVRKT
jgi:hypothetical protein